MNNKIITVGKVNTDVFYALQKIKTYCETKNVTMEEAAVELNKQINQMASLFSFGQTIPENIDYVKILEQGATEEVVVDISKAVGIGALTKYAPKYDGLVFPIYWTGDIKDRWWIDGDYYDLVINKFDS